MVDASKQESNISEKERSERETEVCMSKSYQSLFITELEEGKENIVKHDNFSETNIAKFDLSSIA